MSTKYIYWALLLLLFFRSNNAKTVLKFDVKQLSFPVDSKSKFKLTFTPPHIGDNLEISFVYRGKNGEIIDIEKHQSLLPIDPIANISIPQGEISEKVVDVKGIRLGQVLLSIHVKPEAEVEYSMSSLQISIMRYEGLDIFQKIIGWIYFIAWTISFYPQIYLNFKRKSVIGLNFDYLVYNLLGFIVYSSFTLPLYFSHYIQQLYFRQHHSTIVPVETNDVFFCVHAVIIVSFTIIQCFIYERGDQKVSKPTLVILGAMLLFSLIVICLGGTKLSWLNVIYYLSYVKLVITLIKYIPQAVMNCRRRSTTGWSIENIILDFTGGLLSNVQMYIVAYNYDDFLSIIGNPTKLLLGVFSICFDIFFMIQHYVLFRNNNDYTSIEVQEEDNLTNM